MTTNVTPTIINEGPTKLIVQLLIESDGTSGELTDYSILDPTVDFTPNLSADTQLTITQMWYNCVWFDVAIQFNALNPQTVWTISRDPGDSYMDFRYFGGLKDRSITDHDGKVLISTSGLADVSKSVGTIVIEFKKN